MKRMIIIGVCLVTAAIVYGFADYFQTDKKQLERMYNDEPAAVVPAADKTQAMPTDGPANPEPAVAPAAATVANNVPDDAPANAMPAPATSRRKKLNLKLYSRAALEEKYIAPVESVESEKAVNASLPEIKKPTAPRVETVKTNIGGSPSISSIRKKLDYRLFSRAPLKKVAVVRDTTDSSATAVQAKN